MRSKLLPAFLIISILFLTGCSQLQSRVARTHAGEDIYRPPSPVGGSPAVRTQTAPPTAASQTIPDQPTLTPTPDCEDNLQFIEDLNIPDNSEVQAGEILAKRWQVANNGSCNWVHGYTIQLVTGSDLGTSPVKALYPARSGTSAVIQIEFQAPDVPGLYRSAWQAYSPSGEPFGDQFYIQINVP